MGVRDDALAWVVLARAPGLTVPLLAPALDALGGPGALIGASTGSYDRAGIPPMVRAFLSTPAASATAVERRWLDGEHHHLLPFTHPSYPPLLRRLPDCPLVLHVSGRIEALREPLLAVVGSRNPTPSGRETAAAFSRQLAQRGIGIVSGAAEGIDASAHRGALRAEGITVGVLGTGVDVVYPREHRALCGEIELRGALLSEFPLGTPPRRGNFPRRNRIIAGLSLGTLVIEAAHRSGSLITARLANACGRDVFAVPGSIHSPLSRGCHALLKCGATLVEPVDDILCELNSSDFFAADFPATRRVAGSDPPAAGMDKAHKILLDALGFDPVDLDKLVERTGFKPEVVSSMMLILELEGHVQAAPGGRYSRIATRRAGGER